MKSADFTPKNKTPALLLPRRKVPGTFAPQIANVNKSVYAYYSHGMLLSFTQDERFFLHFNVFNCIALLLLSYIVYYVPV